MNWFHLVTINLGYCLNGTALDTRNQFQYKKEDSSEIYVKKINLSILGLIRCRIKLYQIYLTLAINKLKQSIQ